MFSVIVASDDPRSDEEILRRYPAEAKVMRVDASSVPKGALLPPITGDIAMIEPPDSAQS